MICGGRAATSAVLLLSLFVVAALPHAACDDGGTVTGCLPGGGALAAAALAELAARAMSAAGAHVRAVAPPEQCAPPARADDAACLLATERELIAGRLTAALVAVPAAAAPAAWYLRDAGLDELGDLAPPARRACWHTRADRAAPTARSLLDLADAAVAAHYHLSSEYLNAAIREVEIAADSISINALPIPDSCQRPNVSCATLLTSEEGEARVLMETVGEHALLAHVVALGPRLPAIANALNHSALVCDWALETSEFNMRQARPLGPPPCARDDCPFESRRLIKLVKATALARSPAALRALLRLTLNSTVLRELTTRVRDSDPFTAARDFLDEYPMDLPHDVRMTVFIPDGTTREAYDGIALTAAAASVEEELEDRGKTRGGAHFKMEVYDDRCDAAHAYKYLLDALGTGDYGTLSAVAGPACGAAFADVARQSPAHALPVLAYTAQAAGQAPGAYTLLAAGDARVVSTALGAWLAQMNWHRLAVLSEAATRAALDAPRLHANIFEHLELGDNALADDNESIIQWAQRVAAANGRIIYLCLEDARVVRAALCAGRDAALTPEAGVVWILPAALPSTWSLPKVTDSHNCTREQLEAVAAGHFTLGPNWLVEWNERKDNDTKTSNFEVTKDDWIRRWSTQCRLVATPQARDAVCAQPGAHAALLHDVLHLWAGALDRLFALRPSALNDLHDSEVVRSLVTNAVNGNFHGNTGTFEWTASNEEGSEYARDSPLVLSQWDAGERREVARWWRGVLQLHAASLRWRTVDGTLPDDGTEQCVLRPLADLLRSGCAAAFAALGALLLTLAIAALGAAAVYCRRRAEREYRAKLEALGLRNLPTGPVGLDRWELPRERVVINRKLGMGAFGTVYGGHALLAEGRTWTAVAVKTLKAGATVDEKLDFLSEAEAMKRFDHKNVVRLLAVVTKTEPVCTVMEFMLYGDLKNYLLARRHLAMGAEGEEEEQVSPRRLTCMALDTARALGYLAQLRYVHRDVAARNCLVSSRGVVKLADFGMTRLVFENDYYRFSRKGMLPVRWMAPESLALGVFSPASDVWSFGVLLYEIVTFGSLPFQGLSNAEVLIRVKAGDTLNLPPGIKPQLEELILWCWRRERRARPSAAQLAAALEHAPRMLAPCLDIPLDALPLDDDPPWRLPPDRAEARWVSWGAAAADTSGTAADTDTTYLSDAPRDCDRFLP